MNKMQPCFNLLWIIKCSKFSLCLGKHFNYIKRPQYLNAIESVNAAFKYIFTAKKNVMTRYTGSPKVYLRSRRF